MITLKNITARKKGTLRKAWYLIKHRPDSKGFDEQTIRDFELSLNKEIDQIGSELLSGRYKFIPLRGYPIKKYNGKPRPLKIPAIRDRVVQKAIEITIRKHLEAKYKIRNPVSFAYIKSREGEEVRSVMKAVEKIRSFYNGGCKWIYSADIKKFFDSVDVDLLLDKYIFPALPDNTINQLIKNALNIELGNRAELEGRGFDCFTPDGVGIPQGGTLSPLFANIYLYPLDAAMIKEGFNMVRYADDFVVMCKSENDAYRAHKLAESVIERLNIELYPLRENLRGNRNGKCSTIELFKDQNFLGIQFSGPKMYPDGEQFKKTIAALKRFSRLPRTGLIDDLKYFRMRINAWGAGYYYTDYNKKLYEELDRHLLKAVSIVFKSYGLKPKSGRNILRRRDLKKMHIYTFTQRFDYYKTSKGKI